MAETTTAVATTAKKSPSDLAIGTIKNQLSAGLVLPPTYNYVNAIKASILVLADAKDRDGKSYLETCTPTSIQSALVDMAQKGLDVSKGQGYFQKFGNTLKFMKEYHGATTEIRRMFPEYDPDPRVIYEGDVVEFSIDPATGRRSLVKHEQKFENLDNDFLGAYMYIPRHDCGRELFVMTKKEIMTAWEQSPNKNLSTHKRFPAKMVAKTIINSALTPLVRSEDSVKGGVYVNPTTGETIIAEADAEEVVEPETINVDDAEVVEVASVAEQPSESKEHGEQKLDF